MDSFEEVGRTRDISGHYKDVEARIRLDQDLLEEINLNNGLRQACTMASAQ